MFDLGGKVALVTGGASGLGAAIALGLAERGAEVAIADLNLQSAEHVARQITEMGGPASSWQVDVSQYGEVQDCVESVRTRPLGPLTCSSSAQVLACAGRRSTSNRGTGSASSMST